MKPTAKPVREAKTAVVHSDAGCSAHSLYKAVSEVGPYHAPWCEACCTIFGTSPDRLKVIKALRDAVKAAPQNRETPWWLNQKLMGAT